MCSQDICRLCLKSSSKTTRIFLSDVPCMIETLTCIEVKEGDGLPTSSCEDCISDLRFAYKVRSRIIESDKKLRNSISLFSNQITETCAETSEEIFRNRKVLIENIDNFPDIKDEISIDNSYNDDVKEESSNGDDTIDNLITSIKNDYLEDFCEDTEKQASRIEPQLGEIDENERTTEDCDLLNSEETKDDDEGIVSSTGSISSKQTKEASKDYVILREASDFIHIDTSDVKRKYSCTLCNIKLEPRNVRVHKIKHIKAKCNICGLITRSDNITRHVTTHKSDPKVCDICGTSHKNAESLRVHMYYFHKNQKPYKCKHCSKEFKVSSHLWVHVRRFHTGARPHQCDSCGKAFLTSCILKRHQEQVHQHLRRYPCEHCKKSFSSSNALITHRRQHTGELPYICDVCTEGFRQLVSLRTHMKSRHDVIMKPNKPGYTYSLQFKKELKKQSGNQSSDNTGS